MDIIPMPKTIEYTSLTYIVPAEIKCNFSSFSESLNEELKQCLNAKKIILVDNLDEADVRFIKKNLSEQEYEIEVTNKHIDIYSQDNQGVFYALKTIKQLVQKHQDKPQSFMRGVKIHDYPDLKIRGFMLDISRSKVPQLTTLKKIVDILSDLKYNHLELYVEGFSFEYKSFPDVLNDKNYISLDDYLELEKYANSKYIDLVPNQNGFGHMADWLARDEYHHLAECPDGFYIWGSTRPSSTLDPTNKESYELVKKMYGDMIPHFKSPYFNMNFDEPYELGHGKSKAQCDETSKEEVFIEYLNPLYKVVKDYGKTPLMWGDALIGHPEAVAKLPKDLIFIDWGYTLCYDFMNHSKTLEEKQVKFMCAPGTLTWSTITGRYDDMIGSIKNSALAAKKHHGLGILVTDWGDGGHLQYLPFSYPGIIYGAVCSWGDPDERAISEYLVKLVGPTLSEVIIDLSKYTKLEGPYRDYGSRLFSLILWAEHAMRQASPVDFFLEKMSSNLIEDKALNSLEQLFNDNLKKIRNIESLEKAEIENSINLLLTLIDIQRNIKKWLSGETQNVFDKDILILNAYLKKHYELWCLRNIEPGITPSGNRIKWLIKILTDLEGRRQR